MKTLYSEFTLLTGFYPSQQMYRVIEQAYMDSSMDKQEFCRHYMMNVGGLAEMIALNADLTADN